MYDDLTGKKILKSKALAALEKCSGNDEQMKKLSGIMTEIGFLEEQQIDIYFRYIGNAGETL